jgi:hypothetical protein
VRSGAGLTNRAAAPTLGAMPSLQWRMARPTSATIHTDALRHNLSQVRHRAPGSRVMAVVKADGYGHGLERVARMHLASRH